MVEKKKLPHNGHSRRIVNELCNYLGQDLDSPMCRELQAHVESCPECMEYINSVKLTVTVFRENYKPQPLPEEIKLNLLKIIQNRK